MALKDIPLKNVGTTIQMVGAVYADAERTYTVMLPNREILGEAKEVALSKDEWMDFLRQTDLVEVSALVKDPNSEGMVKAILRKSERQINSIVSWAVFRRDNFQCRYCGTTSEPLTVDHLVTWESGGPSTEANLVASCRKCNGARGETPFDQWLTSPFYKKASKGLEYAGRFANLALTPTLKDIKLVVRKGKRNKKR